MRKTLPALVAVFLVAIVVFGNVVFAYNKYVQVYLHSTNAKIVLLGESTCSYDASTHRYMCPVPKTPGVYEVYVDGKPTGKKVIVVRDSFEVDISSPDGNPPPGDKEALITENKNDLEIKHTVILPARNEKSVIYYPVIIFKPGLDDIEKIDVEVKVWSDEKRNKEGKIITCESTSLTVPCTKGVCKIELPAVNEGPCKTDWIVDARVIVRKIHIKRDTKPYQIEIPVEEHIQVKKPYTYLELKSNEYQFSIQCMYGNQEMCRIKGRIKDDESTLCDDGSDNKGSDNKCTGKIEVPAGEYNVEDIGRYDGDKYENFIGDSPIKLGEIQPGEKIFSKIKEALKTNKKIEDRINGEAAIQIKYGEYLLVDKAYFLPKDVEIVAGAPEFEISPQQEGGEVKAKLMKDTIKIRSPTNYTFSGVVLESDSIRCDLPGEKDAEYTINLMKTFIQPIDNGKYNIFACEKWDEKHEICEEKINTGRDVKILEAPIEPGQYPDNKGLYLKIKDTENVVGHVEVKYTVDNGGKLSENAASYDNDEFEVPIDEKDVKEIYVYIGEEDGYKIHTISSKAITRSGDEKQIQLKYQGTKQEGGIVYNRYRFTYEDFAKYREIYLKLAIEKPDMENPCINTTTGEKPRDKVIGYAEIKIVLRMTKLSGEIQVEKTKVKPGDQIALTLENLSVPDEDEYEYYICYKYSGDNPIQLDKLTNGEKYNDERIYTVDFYGVPGSSADIKVPPDVSEIYFGICKNAQMSNGIESVTVTIDAQCPINIDKEYAIFWSPHIGNWLYVDWKYVKDVTNNTNNNSNNDIANNSNNDIADIAKAVIFHALGSKNSVTYYHVGRYSENGKSYSCFKESGSVSEKTAKLKEDEDNPNKSVVVVEKKNKEIQVHGIEIAKDKTVAIKEYAISHNGKISYVDAAEDGALSIVEEGEHAFLPGTYTIMKAKVYLGPEFTPSSYWVPLSNESITVETVDDGSCKIDCRNDGTISVSGCKDAWAIVGDDDYGCGPGIVKGTWNDIDSSYTITQSPTYILGKTEDGKYNIWYCKKNGDQWKCQSCKSQQ